MQIVRDFHSDQAGVEIIKTLDELPYPVELCTEIMEIKYDEKVIELELYECVIACNLISGVATGESHYMFMEDSTKYFEAIKKYPEIKTINEDVEEFVIRKTNLNRKWRRAEIDNTIGTMKTFYCGNSLTFKR